MARARNIKPGFFKNEELAECSPWARLCFAGLWTLADREGRLEDRPRRIKGELFPFDAVDVEPLLAELAQHGFVLRYSDGSGRALIQVLQFGRHQNPHHKEAASELASPQSLGLLQDEVAPDGEETLGKPEASPGLSGDERAKHGDKTLLNPDSGSLIPETGSLKPESPDLLGNASGFDTFWAAYPHKVCKADAMKAFTKLKAGPDLVAALMQALERHKASEQWRQDKGKFIPHAATWLNGRRWEDELGDAGTTAKEPPDDIRPPWALSAGFATRFDAENAACFEHNHHLFADGRRLKETA